MNLNEMITSIFETRRREDTLVNLVIETVIERYRQCKQCKEIWMTEHGLENAEKYENECEFCGETYCEMCFNKECKTMCSECEESGEC